MTRRSMAPAIVVATVIAATAQSARADDAARACAASFEQSQYLQKDGKLSDARVAALACAASTCPAFVRDACQKLLADIDATKPTVVLGAQDATGADLVRVRVELDGQPFVAELGAEAVPIDPGSHTLRFIYADQPPIDVPVLVRIAEKNRPVKVVFHAAPTGGAAIPAPVSGRSASGPLWPSLVLGSAGLAMIGVSIGVGVAAKSEADNLRSTCAPGCSPSDVADVNTHLVVSDVLLGVGVAAVGVATVLLILRSGGHEASAAALRIVPSTGGGFALAF